MIPNGFHLRADIREWENLPESQRMPLKDLQVQRPPPAAPRLARASRQTPPDAPPLEPQTGTLKNGTARFGKLTPRTHRGSLDTIEEW